MIVLTTKLQCLTCGRFLGVGFFANVDKRPLDLAQHAEELRKLAAEHRCDKSQPGHQVVS